MKLICYLARWSIRHLNQALVFLDCILLVYLASYLYLSFRFLHCNLVGLQFFTSTSQVIGSEDWVSVSIK